MRSLTSLNLIKTTRPHSFTHIYAFLFLIMKGIYSKKKNHKALKIHGSVDD